MKTNRSALFGFLLFATAFSAVAQTNTFPSSGNTGIGTTSPATALDVLAPSNSTKGLLKLQSSNSNHAGLTFWTGGGATMRNWQVSNNYASAGGLSFMRSSSNTGDPTTSVMELDGAGNVGIGTTTPGAKIEMKGDELRIRSLFSKTDTLARDMLLLTSDDTVGTNNLAMAFSLQGAAAGGSRCGQIQVGDWGYFWGSLNLNPYGGNVGIGTTSPTHTLSVNGTIRAKEIIVDTGWSDYVFADDYRLAPLSEIEAHLKAERHLPGIPSAQEVAEHGVSMGEMQSKLLAKIEELTLHAIAQEKALAAQQQEFSARLARLEQENTALRRSR